MRRRFGEKLPGMVHALKRRPRNSLSSTDASNRQGGGKPAATSGNFVPRRK